METRQLDPITGPRVVKEESYRDMHITDGRQRTQGKYAKVKRRTTLIYLSFFMAGVNADRLDLPSDQTHIERRGFC